LKNAKLLLLLGLLLGLAGGLVYAWLINPVQYYDTYPPMMRSDYREEWIRLSVLSYAAGGDLARVQLRLQDLSEDEIRQVAGQTLEEAIATGRPLPVLRRIAAVAQVYDVDTPAVRIYTDPAVFTVTLAPPVTPQATQRATTSAFEIATATPTMRPLPTITPSPTVVPTPTLPVTPTATFTVPYQLAEQQHTCVAQPLIAITVAEEVTTTVRGRERREKVMLPGVEVWLLWSDGADHAVTGFKPERNLGYVDFAVEPESVYNIYLGIPTGLPIASLSVGRCVEEGRVGWTGWALTVLKQTEEHTSTETPPES